jgi:outer membrane lipopolysaccharide assembly protein LptE/RlpB
VKLLSVRSTLAALAMAIFVACNLLSGCGYHVAGKATRLPQNVHVLAVPVFINQTQTYRIEQILTHDVVREFLGRTRYRVVTTAADSDATLKGTVLSAQASPLTYDAQSGRISSAVVTVSMKVTLTDKAGRVLFENPNYTFREQYQVSREVTSFFEEETPALQRMSQDFARTLVSDILEAF